MPMEEMMKTNKVTKLGVSLLSVAALGVVAPALIDVPVFGASVVKAEERGPLEYTIAYYDKDTGEEIAPRKTGTINPGESVNIYRDIDGYQVVSNFDEWMPGFNATYRIVSENFGFSDGRLFMDLSYKKVNADAKPSDTSKPEVKPETKPSDTPKPEVKPESKPSDTPKPEVKPEPKPSETPKPEVKPEPAPKDEEKQEPLKYRIDYFDADTGEEISREYGVLNPGETINIYKDIEGYEVVSKYSWMPGYKVDYPIMSEYFGGTLNEHYMYLNYKKVNADAKPSETPKPEVKPETKPSETPKPEVKPEPAPKDEEKQEPIKYRIRYLDEHSREIASMETGVLNPGESINIHKDIEGYQVVSNYSWMPGYNLTHDIASTFFYGAKDGYLEGYLRYKKLDADAKPSDTPKPEVKPETKPSDTPKPEVKPAPKPSETPKPEVKPEPAPKDEEKQEPIKYRIRHLLEGSNKEIAPMETGVLNPGESINIRKNLEGYQAVSNYSWMPDYNLTHDIVSTYFYGAADGYREGYIEYRKLDADAKPSDTLKPEVKPAPKPSDTPKPEVKPAPKPSETPKPEVKPAPKPSETPKPEVKPAPKPSDTSKPEVKPAPQPSDTSKPEVKPEIKPQTNSNTAPTAPVKPVGQTSNSKADKPTSKKETSALPNTGEQSSSLSLVGLLLASLGLAGLTYKGRH